MKSTSTACAIPIIRSGTTFSKPSKKARCLPTEEDAGLHFLMRIDTEIPDTVIMERALARGLRLTSLSQYFHQPPEDVEHIFIINYSYLETEHIPGAVELLYRCLETE